MQVIISYMVTIKEKLGNPICSLIPVILVTSSPALYGFPHAFNPWAFLASHAVTMHLVQVPPCGPLPPCLPLTGSQKQRFSFSGREGKVQLAFTIFYSIASFWAPFSSMTSQADLNSFTLVKSNANKQGKWS